jgi:hypothetical protein
MTGQARSIGAILPFLAGPLIWAAHFFALYLTESYACASMSSGIVSAIGLGGTLLALAAISFAAWTFWRSAQAGDSRNSLAAFALPLALLSGVAIVWTALPILLLPACAVATG